MIHMQKQSESNYKEKKYKKESKKMKKKIIIVTIIMLIATIATFYIGYVVGYNHVVKNQYMEECSDYNNMYYIIVDGNRYLYEK